MVVPTHNRWNHLRRAALPAALGQREVELELIVVDDGSADETPRGLAEVADPRLRVLRNDVAQGVAGARNRGVAAASAPWVAFLDDDDLWSPWKLRRQLDAVGAVEGAGFAYAAAVFLDGAGAPLRPDPAPPAETVARALTGARRRRRAVHGDGPHRARAGAGRLRRGAVGARRLGPVAAPGRPGARGRVPGGAGRIPRARRQHVGGDGAGRVRGARRGQAAPRPRIRAGRRRVHPLGGRAPAPRRPAVSRPPGPTCTARASSAAARCSCAGSAMPLGERAMGIPAKLRALRGNKRRFVSPDWVDCLPPRTGGGRLRIGEIALTLVTGARDGFWPIQRVGGALCAPAREPFVIGPQVTVVIPTRDRWPTVTRAVACALHQQGVDVEVIVVDDGSRDRDDRRARPDQRRAPARPAPPRLRGRGPRAQRRDQGGAWRLGGVPGRRRRLVAAQAAPPARDGARRPGRLRLRAGGARALPGRRGAARRSAAARQPGAAPARR